MAALLAAGILFRLYQRAVMGSLLLLIENEKVRQARFLLVLPALFCLLGWLRMNAEMEKWPLEAVLAEREYGEERGGKAGKRVQADFFILN